MLPEIRRFAIFFAAILSALVSTPAISAPGDNAPVRYIVRKGDNLITLGKRYFMASTSYKIVQQQNRIADPHIIPVGKVLIIPRTLLKYRPATATLISVRGQVAAGDAAASTGQILREGTALNTGPSSFVTMRLDDGSLVSLPSNSNVRIRFLRRYALGDSLDYDFEIIKGGVRSSVTKHKSADDRYRVRTPKAVSAVRGTDFQSRFDPDSNADFAEVVEGGLAVDAGSGADRVVPAGNGLAVKDNGGVITEALLSPPMLQEPGKTQSDKIVRFAAQAERGVRYTIGKDAGFIDQVADVIASNGKADFDAVPNGNYFIRARAISDNGIQGIPATFAFKRRLNGVSASAGPSDEGYVFRWTGEGEGTQKFHFQLFRDATDRVAFVDEAGLSNDRVTLSDLPPGDYFWRVAVVQYLDGEVSINWTPLEKLTVSGS